MGHVTCLQATINFNTGHYALISQHIHKGLAVSTRLVQSLLKHDGPADVLAQVWGSVQQLAPVSSVGLCVVNSCTPNASCSFQQTKSTSYNMLHLHPKANVGVQPTALQPGQILHTQHGLHIFIRALHGLNRNKQSLQQRLACNVDISKVVDVEPHTSIVLAFMIPNRIMLLTTFQIIKLRDDSFGCQAISI